MSVIDYPMLAHWSLLLALLARSAADECLRPGRSMQLVLVSDVIAPGLCPAINTAYRLGWHTHVINFRGANASELRDGKLGPDSKKCKVQSKQGNLRSATFGTEVTCVRWAFQLPKRAEDCRAARA